MKEDLRIVALADSLAMPRPAKNDARGVAWSETWPKRLEYRLRRIAPECEVISAGKRSRTATELEEREYVSFIEPDIIVLQVGIVDCAPRVFSRLEHRLLRFLPLGVRERLIKYRSRNRALLTARNPLRKVYTRPRVFERAMRNFKSFLENRPHAPQAIVLPILVHSSLQEKSKGYFQNAALYNGILKKIWGDSYIAPETVGHGDKDFFLEDGQHLTPAGNDAVAGVLYSKIVEFFPQKQSTDT